MHKWVHCDVEYRVKNRYQLERRDAHLGLTVEFKRPVC